MLAKLSTSEKCYHYSSTWFIWCTRNAVKHQGKYNLAASIQQQVFSHLWKTEQAKILKVGFWRGDTEIAKSWGFFPRLKKSTKIIEVFGKLLEENWLKLNCDGASKRNLGSVGVGGVMRNQNGDLVCGYYSFLGNYDNFYTEIADVVRGVEICVKHGFGT